MPFVKLDTKILDSTLWVERDCREVFITALLMAEPVEINEAIEAIKVGSLEPLGFTIEPGWYGFVPAAGPGIVRRAMVGEENGMEALARLSLPDPGSRSPEYEGRRMVRVPGGYLILNYMRYRDKDYTAAERQRRLRQRKKLNTVTRDGDTVTPLRHELSRIADADTDADADKTHTTRVSLGSPEFKAFFEAYPVQTGRKAALSEWVHQMLDTSAFRVMDSLEAWKHSERWSNPKFIPYAAKWLSDQWRSEPVKGTSPNEQKRQATKQAIERVRSGLGS